MRGYEKMIRWYTEQDITFKTAGAAECLQGN